MIFPPRPKGIERDDTEHGRLYYTADDLRRYGLQCVEEYKRCQRKETAPQPAQDVPEVGFGNMPYSPYLFGGLRFKMNFDKSGNATNFHGVESSLQGAWVALVDATDNRHLQSAQPVAQPLTLEQILDIVKKLDETPDMSHVDVLKTFARAIEAAHGIREVK